MKNCNQHCFLSVSLFTSSLIAFCRASRETNLPSSQRDVGEDGVQLGPMDPSRMTTLINGKGKSRDGANWPVTIYNVASGKRIRFRAVHAGAEHSYDVSVDNHDIYVVASDGYDISPMKVTKIQMLPGEA